VHTSLDKSSANDYFPTRDRQKSSLLDSRGGWNSSPTPLSHSFGFQQILQSFFFFDIDFFPPLPPITQGQIKAKDRHTQERYQNTQDKQEDGHIPLFSAFPNPPPKYPHVNQQPDHRHPINTNGKVPD